MAFRLFAERDSNVRFLKNFKTAEAAMDYVFALDERGRWVEGFDAILENVVSAERLFLDGDRWSPLAC